MVIRHILIIAPILLIVAGIGLYSTINYFIHHVTIRKIYSYGIIVLIFALFLSVWIVQLNSTIKRPTVNREYDPYIIKELADMIKYESTDRHEIRLTSRKHYLGYYAGSVNWTVPYTDYEGLVNFIRVNNIDYFFLEYGAAGRFPFVDSFSDGYDGDNFELLYETIDRNGQRVALYKFINING